MLGLAARSLSPAAAVLLLASWLFHVALWRDAPRLAPDSHGYMESAADLQDLSLDALHDRTPGYPALVLLTGSSAAPRRALFFVQLSLHFVATAFLAWVAFSVGVRAWLVLLLVFVASLPPSVAPAGYVLSESPAEFTLAVAVGAFLLALRRTSRVWLAVACLSTASAALVRPTYQLLGPALAVTLLWLRPFLPRRAVHRGATWLLVAPSLLVVCFILFNQWRFGFPGLTPLFGFNLTTRTIHFAERIPEADAAIRTVLVARRDSVLVATGSEHTGYMSVWKAIPDLQVATGLERAELSQKMARLNLQLVRSAPLNYLAEVLRAMAAYWMPTPPDLANCGSRSLQLVWGLCTLGALLLFWLHGAVFAGLLCFARLVPRQRWIQAEDEGLVAGAAAGLVVVVYTMFVSALVETGNPRYRTPTELLLWFSLLAGIELWLRLRGRARTAAAAQTPS